MRRAFALAALVGGLSACSGGGGGPQAACDSFTIPAASPGGPPPGILHSAAAGPFEYLIGTPGGALAKLPLGTSVAQPRLVAGQVFYTALVGGNKEELRVARLGGCARRLAAGTLDLVDPTGREVTVFAGNKRLLIDVASGRTLATLAPATFAWTGDGRLVAADARQVTVRQAGGPPRIVATGYHVLTGTLGRTGVILGGGAAVTSLLDVDSGQLTQLLPRRLDAAAGSLDGTWLAAVDGTGPSLVKLPEMTTTPLPQPGPVLGVSWSPDSAWVTVQTPFGGVLVRAADGTHIDLGALNVVSW